MMIQGGLVLDGARVEGWCWAPDRPGERLAAELLIDGEVVAVIVAARLREELVATGIGDGRHAFELRLPPEWADGARIIEARDQASGTIFGRIALRPDVAPLPPALGRVADELRQCWTALAGRDVRIAPGAQVAAALGALGDALAARGRVGRAPNATQVALAHFARRFPPLMLPGVQRPDLAIVLRASPAIADTIAALRALAPCLEPLAAEVVLVDDGCEPLSALVPSLVRNVALVCAIGRGDAARDNLAVERARASRLAFLDAAPPTASLLALRGIGTAWPVVVGRPVLLCADRMGAGSSLDAHPVPLSAPTGVRLLVDRRVIEVAGGFDHAVDDGGALASLDLCLKARLAGFAVAALAEPSAGGLTGVPVSRHLPAEAAFATRWPRARAEVTG